MSICPASFSSLKLKDKFGQIRIFAERRDGFVHHLGGNGDRLPAAIGGGKADFLQQFFQNRVQAACADVFDRLVNVHRQMRQRGDGIIFKNQRHVFGAHQGFVLFDQAGFGFGQNTAKIFFGQRRQLHTDRQAAADQMAWRNGTRPRQ